MITTDEGDRNDLILLATLPISSIQCVCDKGCSASMDEGSCGGINNVMAEKPACPNL